MYIARALTLSFSISLSLSLSLSHFPPKCSFHFPSFFLPFSMNWNTIQQQSSKVHKYLGGKKRKVFYFSNNNNNIINKKKEWKRIFHWGCRAWSKKKRVFWLIFCCCAWGKIGIPSQEWWIFDKRSLWVVEKSLYTFLESEIHCWIINSICIHV